LTELSQIKIELVEVAFLLGHKTEALSISSELIDLLKSENMENEFKQ
jgi:hypothetical protein